MVATGDVNAEIRMSLFSKDKKKIPTSPSEEKREKSVILDHTLCVCVCVREENV